MRKPLYVLFAILLIDAIGPGLITPTLPGLLRGTAGGGDGDGDGNSFHYGALLAAYALAQFLCAPPPRAAGFAGWRRSRLSADGPGSRPGGAPPGPCAGRHHGRRHGHGFGQMGSAIGVGFIAGPVLGGLPGERMLSAPSRQPGRSLPSSPWPGWTWAQGAVRAAPSARQVVATDGNCTTIFHLDA